MCLPETECDPEDLQMKRYARSLLRFATTASFVLTLPLPLGAEATEQRVRVAPRENEEVFANPGFGWQTFHRFGDEDKNLAGLPSSSAYFRFCWREIEPRDGQIDFARFDELLAHARRAGQKLAFRVMCTGFGQYMDVPSWLKEQNCRGVEFNYGGSKHWVPDFGDREFQGAHFRLIRDLGQHYDGHPHLDLVDIGSVGLWGEWHMSGTSQVDTGKPVPLPPFEVRMAIIDAWCRAFPQTSKVVQIGSEEGMAQAAARGFGWRADCLGDMGGFLKTWNHMEDFYLQQVAKTGAQEVWKTAPVAFESCWDMRKWKEAGWDIRYIFDYALRCHVSYVNNKSAPLPDGACTEVERFLRRAGYRLVIRSLEHVSVAKPGQAFVVSVLWENVGVAPPYRDYRVALRLKNVDDKNFPPVVLVTDDSVRGWLPGTKKSELSVQMPEGTQTGKCELAIGVVDPTSKMPAVRLGIEGRDPEGWYPLSHLEIVR